MSETFGQMLQSINNSEIRITLEKIFGILGLQPGDSTGPSALTGDIVGDVTGNLAGDVTGNVSGNLTGNVSGNLAGNVTGDVTGTATVAERITADDPPVNAAKADFLLTFTDGSADGELIVVGADTYEIDIDAGGVTEGNIAVDLITGAVTKENAATAFTAAVVGNAGSLFAATDPSDGTVVMTSKIAGVLYNDVVIDTTGAAHCSDDGASAGGIDGTVGSEGEIRFDTAAVYVCTADNDITGDNWYKATLAQV